MVHEGFGIPSINEQPHEIDEVVQSDESTAQFLKLLKDAETELYEGCENFTTLSFVVELMHLKSISKWSNSSFMGLLKLLKHAIASRQGAKDATTLSMINELQKESDEQKATDQDTPRRVREIIYRSFWRRWTWSNALCRTGVTKTMVYGRQSGSQTTSIESIVAIRLEFEEKFEKQKQDTEAHIQAERDACKAEMELKL